MSVTTNDKGELIRVTEWGVEALTVQGVPVRDGYSYCSKCPSEFLDVEDLKDHYEAHHGRGR